VVKGLELEDTYLAKESIEVWRILKSLLNSNNSNILDVEVAKCNFTRRKGWEIYSFSSLNFP